MKIDSASIRDRERRRVGEREIRSEASVVVVVVRPLVASSGGERPLRRGVDDDIYLLMADSLHRPRPTPATAPVRLMASLN